MRLAELRSLTRFGLPGYYADRGGRVISVRVLTPQRRSDTHPRLKLQVEGRTVEVHVARLVAKVFLGRAPRGLPHVSYRDGDSTNVRPSNLFYSAPAVRGERIGSAKLTDRKVRSILRALARGVSPSALAKRYGVSRETIYGIGARRTWRHIA